MAKTALAHAQTTPRTRQGLRRATPEDAAAGPVIVLSAKTRGLIDAIRDEFDAFTGGFAQLEHDRAVLAPKFMRAFAAWKAETGGAFVVFVRTLDPRVPADRDGYRAHPAYQAADYLRRLQANVGREQEEVPEEERPRSTYQALGYLVATVLPIVDPHGVIWRAFVREMRWSEEQAQRIKVMAAKLPTIKLPVSAQRRTGTEG